MREKTREILEEPVHIMTKCEQAFFVYLNKEVIAIYAVYLDVYFLENLILDISVLALTSLIWDKRLKWKRIVLAAIVGAALASVMLLLRVQGASIRAILNLLPGIFMLKLAFWRSKLQELIRGAMYFYTISFVFSKGYRILQARIGGIHGMLICISVLLMIGIAISYLKYCKRKEDEDVYYDVEILGKGKKVQVRALYDTGNVLTEPVSGKPVSVVEKALMEEIWKLEEPQRYKYIPYRSVGKEHGIIMGMEVDGLLILKDGERMERYGEIVALYDGQLSSDGRFKMILHQDVMLEKRNGR